MSYQSTTQLNCLSLHDSPISELKISDSEIKLKLASAILGKGHELNPFLKAQYIEPCELTFRSVTEQQLVVWDDRARKFLAHPEPSNPFRDEIMEFEVNAVAGTLFVKLTGFHSTGWAEWTFRCSDVDVKWDYFAGDAWFEQ